MLLVNFISYNRKYYQIKIDLITLSRANWGPLKAVLGRFSSADDDDDEPFSPGDFFGFLVRGPICRISNLFIYVYL